ncbi:hypothetical protein FRX31_024287 [Thalictrum thalictroides]|uniref:Uncharacterized protein n=1 Tax=Thalictrum thalictroides TaxID=46969 RepID=A0A7J6VMH6_THATH|nr:hypothetical protein FRX31_024287 [Thalictrum thalictroides]
MLYIAWYEIGSKVMVISVSQVGCHDHELLHFSSKQKLMDVGDATNESDVGESLVRTLIFLLRTNSRQILRKALGGDVWIICRRWVVTTDGYYSEFRRVKGSTTSNEAWDRLILFNEICQESNDLKIMTIETLAGKLRTYELEVQLEQPQNTSLAFNAGSVEDV